MNKIERVIKFKKNTSRSTTLPPIRKSHDVQSEVKYQKNNSLEYWEAAQKEWLSDISSVPELSISHEISNMITDLKASATLKSINRKQEIIQQNVDTQQMIHVNSTNRIPLFHCQEKQLISNVSQVYENSQVSQSCIDWMDILPINTVSDNELCYQLFQMLDE